MSWLDFAILLAVLVSMGVGWARGSVWFSSALAAGFVGLWAADTYAPVVADSLHGFPGAEAVATVLVFVVAATLVVGVGFILRKILSVAFLGLVDRLSGFIVGGALGTALTVIVLALIFVIKPQWRDAEACKKSFFLSKMETRVLSLSRLTQAKPHPFHFPAFHFPKKFF